MQGEEEEEFFPDGKRRWYVLHVKPRTEKKVAGQTRKVERLESKASKFSEKARRVANKMAKLERKKKNKGQLTQAQKKLRKSYA